VSSTVPLLLAIIEALRVWTRLYRWHLGGMFVVGGTLTEDTIRRLARLMVNIESGRHVTEWQSGAPAEAPGAPFITVTVPPGSELGAPTVWRYRPRMATVFHTCSYPELDALLGRLKTALPRTCETGHECVDATPHAAIYARRRSADGTWATYITDFRLSGMEDVDRTGAMRLLVVHRAVRHDVVVSAGRFIWNFVPMYSAIGVLTDSAVRDEADCALKLSSIVLDTIGLCNESKLPEDRQIRDLSSGFDALSPVPDWAIVLRNSADTVWMSVLVPDWETPGTFRFLARAAKTASQTNVSAILSVLREYMVDDWSAHRFACDEGGLRVCFLCDLPLYDEAWGYTCEALDFDPDWLGGRLVAACAICAGRTGKLPTVRVTVPDPECDTLARNRARLMRLRGIRPVAKRKIAGSYYKLFLVPPQANNPEPWLLAVGGPEYECHPVDPWLRAMMGVDTWNSRLQPGHVNVKYVPKARTCYFTNLAVLK
jgi:hypothetical protein